MKLISIEYTKNGWRIQYESKATDGIPVKVRYPSLSDIGLGKPTREFYQAIAQFLRMAIAISHLDKAYWLEKGKVTAIRIKSGKDEEAIQISVVADNNDSFHPPTVTTNWIEFSALMSLLQPDPEAPFLNGSIEDLEQEVRKYINGDRFSEQGQLDLGLVELTLCPN
jgi:hypothetical protein